MTISVPIILRAIRIGVVEGGVLSQSLNKVEISCFPTNVPENIELNIEDLELNSAKNVGDLKVNIEELEIISDPNLNIVSITPPVADKEVEDEVDETDKDEADVQADKEVSKDSDEVGNSSEK